MKLPDFENADPDLFLCAWLSGILLVLSVIIGSCVTANKYLEVAHPPQPTPTPCPCPVTR